MKKKKSILALMMVIVMCMLSACGTKFDAKAYIESCLDVQFKGEYDEYMKLTESSKKDSEKLYNDGIDTFMEGYESLSLPDELEGKFRDAYKKMLKSAKYSIKESKETDDGFVVTVAVKPMKCFENYEADLQKLQQEFLADMQEKIAKDGKMPSQQEIMEQMAEIVYNDLEERISKCEYDKEVTVDVKVKKDSNKKYTANETDLGKVAQKALGV